MKITAVIMAGGRGERFWPKSRNNRPKQFLSLTSDGETMIQKTVKRLSPLVSAEDIFIVTNAAYADLVNDQLPDVPRENILCEPCARNTAPCIAFAAAIIQKKYGDAMMLVLPSDHLIGYENIYIKTLQTAIRTAEEGNNLVTIGITPAYPETGYGYINFGKEAGDAYEVERFVEKPDLPTAKKYLATGKYLWNSGMFVWKASTILEKFAELLPDIYACLTTIGDAMNTPDEDRVIQEVYPVIPKISIDYGILERSDDVLVLSGDFGWNDVGSWDMMKVIYDEDAEGNILVGDHVNIDTTNTISFSSGKMIATIGVDNLVVVETEDAILVCDKNRVQDVKKVVDTLNEQGRTDLL